MNEMLPSHEWMRSAQSVLICRITDVQAAPGARGTPETTLRIVITEVLFGQKRAPERVYRVELPASQAARQTSPDLSWGRVTLERGTSLFSVTDDASKMPGPPRYAEQIGDTRSPVFQSLRATLAAERTAADPALRRARYFGGLGSGAVLQKAFAVDALSKDSDLPDVAPQGTVAEALASMFAHDASVYVRLIAGQRLWEDLLSRTNTAGKAAIVAATTAAVSDPLESIRSSARDRLSERDPAAVARTTAQLPQGATLLAPLPNFEENLASPAAPDVGVAAVLSGTRFDRATPVVIHGSFQIDGALWGRCGGDALHCIVVRVEGRDAPTAWFPAGSCDAEPRPAPHDPAARAGPVLPSRRLFQS